MLGHVGALSPNVEKYGHALRDFRNYVHPAHNFVANEHTARISFHVVVRLRSIYFAPRNPDLGNIAAAAAPLPVTSARRTQGAPPVECGFVSASEVTKLAAEPSDTTTGDPDSDECPRPFAVSRTCTS